MTSSSSLPVNSGLLNCWSSSSLPVNSGLLNCRAVYICGSFVSVSFFVSSVLALLASSRGSL